MTTIAGAQPPGGVRARRLSLRHLWLIPGIGLALLASTQATSLHVGLVPLLVFGIVPHLTVLVGIGQAHAPGQLAPRAVPLFSATHRPLVPAVVLGLAAAGVLPPFWLVGALAWLGHIVVDWALGTAVPVLGGIREQEPVSERVGKGPIALVRQPLPSALG